MEEKKKELLFMQLIMQNQQMALVSLGKTVHPVSNKIEKNLEYAKLSIDTLDMLKAKTKGNLSDYEEKYLDEVLSQLKLDYIKESDGEK